MKSYHKFFQALPYHDGTDHDHDEERKEKIKKIHDYSNQCVEESGTTEEVSKQLVNGDFSVRDEKAQVSIIDLKNRCTIIKKFCPLF